MTVLEVFLFFLFFSVTSTAGFLIASCSPYCGALSAGEVVGTLVVGGIVLTLVFMAIWYFAPTVAFLLAGGMFGFALLTALASS